MMRDLIKISLFILLVSSFSEANEEFRNSSDKTIVQSILNNFSKNCSLIMTVQEGILFNLDLKYKQAQDEKNQDALYCFSNNLNKVKSVQFIYKNICQDLTQNGIPFNDEAVMRTFISSREYKKGILIPHSVLNDCLIGRNVDEKYLVKVFSGKDEFNLLVEKLKRLGKKSDFAPNRVNFR